MQLIKDMKVMCIGNCIILNIVILGYIPCSLLKLFNLVLSALAASLFYIYCGKEGFSVHNDFTYTLLRMTLD